MGTTYGPSDRTLRPQVAGRPAFAARVIPIDRQHTRSSHGARVERQPDSAKLIHWPHKPDEESDSRAVASPRRRRRSVAIRQWLPTALFVSVVVGLIVLLMAVRMMMGASNNAQNVQAPPVEVAAAPAIEVASAPAANPAPPPAKAQGQIRFTSKVIDPSYTVAAGDNLWGIAEKNRTTVEAIESINNLPQRATLSVGQRLVMP